jgi:hypothetical protein
MESTKDERLEVSRSRESFVGSSLAKLAEPQNLGRVFHPKGSAASICEKNIFRSSKILLTGGHWSTPSSSKIPTLMKIGEDYKFS